MPNIWIPWIIINSMNNNKLNHHRNGAKKLLFTFVSNIFELIKNTYLIPTWSYSDVLFGVSYVDSPHLFDPDLYLSPRIFLCLQHIASQTRLIGGECNTSADLHPWPTHFTPPCLCFFYPSHTNTHRDKQPGLLVMLRDELNAWC